MPSPTTTRREPFTFFLGVHQPAWLAETDVPLMISRRRLAPVRRLPRARGTWTLDSGGFSELALFGRWTISGAEYAAEVRRYANEIGGELAWAAIMDWVCEPDVRAVTGLSVREHQLRTLASYAELRSLAPDLPWLPVIQGWTPDDYLAHADMYEQAGFDLAALPAVGVGSVCRRQRTEELEIILRSLAVRGYRLHGFGLKTTGLRRAQDALVSSDSMTWSFVARRLAPLTQCKGHKTCANCLRFALLWRHRLIERLSEPT
jgi:hypothetical protein